MATAQAYGHAGYHAMLGGWSWTGTAITCGLYSSAYTPDPDNHEWVSDLTGEAAGGGYSRKTLTTKTLTYDAGSNSAIASCDQVSWTGLTATFRYVFFCADFFLPTVSPLLFYIDYGSDQVVTAGTWNLPVPATGYLTTTV